ncbi:D-inositol-3-phosphate glycosyltransferase [Nanoarchaeota archaeon]
MIFIYNWRDKKHRRSGGSETYIFNIIKYINDKILFFTSKDKNLNNFEEYNNIKIFRFGIDYLPILISLFSLFKLFKYRPKIIIENINHIPFFIPYKKIVIVHHLSGKQALYEYPFLSIFVWFFEYIIFPLFYRNKIIITVSESTKELLKKLGFERVYVIHNGINRKNIIIDKKENAIVYLGRIMKYKRIEHIILSFYLVKKKVKDAKLYIIGREKNKKYLNKLKELVNKLKLKDVYFLGYVDENKKEEILKKSKVIVMTSVVEGWGIGIIEGNSYGCVSIGYNVRGLKDSIKNNYSGFLVENNNIKELSNKIIELLENEELFNKMSKNSIEYSKNFDWDKSARKFEKILKLLTNI